MILLKKNLENPKGVKKDISAREKAFAMLKCATVAVIEITEHIMK